MTDELDFGRARRYLEQLLVATGDADPAAVDAAFPLPSAQAEPGWVQTLRVFAADASVPVVFVEAQHADAAPAYTLALKPSFAPQRQTLLALAKRSTTLDTSAPLALQLRVVSLVGGAPEGAEQSATEEAPRTLLETPYETLHSVVQNVMTPWFDAYVASQEQGADDGAPRKDEDRAGVPVAKRKFAELELSLLQLQQNVEIPQVQLHVHPVVRDTVERCAREARRVSVEAVEPAALLADDAFVNQLHSDMNGWVRAVQTLTKLDRDVASGSAAQEINFWNAMERALEDMEQQLQAPAIALTLEILTHAKRFHATVSFHADTGVKDCMEKVRSYNLLMKDFPLGALLSAATLPACAEAVREMFAHLNRKLRVSAYPVRRALAFVEALSAALNETLLKLLAARSLMHLDHARCAATLDEADEAFAVWDECIKEFVYVARDVTRKRGDKFIPIKIQPAHARLRERLAYVRRLRSAHEELLAMADVGKAWAAGSSAAPTLLAEIHAAFDAFRTVDVLDVSERGTQALDAAELAYSDRIAQVENRLIDALRELLAHARSARERLRILAQYNRLFVRPRVRAAVHEYQQMLLQSVRSDVQALHAKFRAGYRHSEANVVAQLRDEPEIVGAVVWARELERQLNVYLGRVEDVLGAGWAHYADGQAILEECDAFRHKLDVRPLVTAWCHEMSRRGTRIHGPLLRVVRERGAARLALRVQYDAQLGVFAREAHQLAQLGLAVPQGILAAAHEARQARPYALTLLNALRAAEQATHTAAALPLLQPLLARAQLEVRDAARACAAVRWEHLHHGALLPGGAEAAAAPVERLAAAVVALEERVAALAAVQERIDAETHALRTCAYEDSALRSHLGALQQQVDAVNFAGYPNLDGFLAALDERVCAVLLERLEGEISRWTEALGGADGAGGAVAASAAPPADPVRLVLRMQDQAIAVDPPVDAARAQWLDRLSARLNVVLRLPRLQAGAYGLDLGSDAPGEHRFLLARLPARTLSAPVARVQRAADAAEAYTQAWLQLQFLYDAEPAALAAQLGERLDAWLGVFSAMRETRAFVEAPATRRAFGVVLLDVEPVQSRVTAKLDAWQKELLASAAATLGAQMDAVHGAMHAGRRELEQLSASAAAPTAQVVRLVTAVQTLTQELRHWEPQLAQFAAVQATLSRLRFRFPEHWRYAEALAGERAALAQILAQKRTSIEAQHEALQQRVAREDRLVAERSAALAAAWAEQRPLRGTLPVDEALGALDRFAAQLGELREAGAMLARAKEAFGLPARAEAPLAALAEEHAALQDVWGAVRGVWAQLGELERAPLATLNARQVRQRLEALVHECRALPGRLRQYDAVAHVQEELQFRQKHVALLGELRSEAVKERHWRALFKQLRVPQRFAPALLTLGFVWGLDLRRNGGALRELVAQAQGEYALDVYLQQVREAWTGYALELTPYRHECVLLRGLDALFQLAGEHSAGLRAMGASPHYRVFEEEAHLWEERLARIQGTFDHWAEVQRQWVYLNGVFGASSEIRHILPAESARFQSISTEFLVLLRRVQKAPYVLDVVNIPGVQRHLERLEELLHKVQKALGEYLERERARFPRFYFVGDEDLLEMLGSSRRDVTSVARHLGKMFGGAAAVRTEGDGAVSSVVSREGEALVLDEHVQLGDEVPVYAWLAALERSMRVTLAERTTEAVSALEPVWQAAGKPGAGAAGAASTDGAPLLPWLDAFPAQAAVLAAQVVWTHAVEAALPDLAAPLAAVETLLQQLADALAADAPPLRRRKCEQLVTELTHQREVLVHLGDAHAATATAFPWLAQLRYYLDAAAAPAERIRVCLANATFTYGFEYLGAPERLVQTPLTTAVFLTLTQALRARCFGECFGPAGTGKTETVKALGAALGRLVLVFNCDRQFDFQAMGRLFLGVCRVGAFGCFDEFNRLEERVLSSVSQQVQAIQQGLASRSAIELVGRTLHVHEHTGVFVTMNPTYAGRSRLPDNLRTLFRSAAMTRPDERLIAQVLLLAQGFRAAATLAPKVVLLFRLLGEQLSRASHYDFGLRALKGVLVSAGQLRREALRPEGTAAGAEAPAAVSSAAEHTLLVDAVCETVPPRLLAADVPLLDRLLADVFPSVQHTPRALEALRTAIDACCAEAHLLPDAAWAEKLVQLYRMQQLAHGLILVGPAGSGKTCAWRSLLAALERVEQVPSAAYVIEPKVLSKGELYGTLDATTREWRDGLFTHLLRRIHDHARRSRAARHWIVFDGDVDPEWVENLNSVLDDNRVLTLPTGERLSVPPSVRILFEVDSLAHATPATVSRCGMLWFSGSLVTRGMRLHHALGALRSAPVGGEDEFVSSLALARAADAGALQAQMAEALAPAFAPDALVPRLLDEAHAAAHVMHFSDARAVATLLSLLRRAAREALAYNARHPDFPLAGEALAGYARRSLAVALVWALAGDAPLAARAALGEALGAQAAEAMPPGGGGALVDHDVAPAPGAPYAAWAERVPVTEVDTAAVATEDVVVPTTDTVRHEELVHAYLLDHRPVVLCGPPGSGKTMVLFAALRRVADLDVAALNFSSQTTPGLLLKLLEQHCEYHTTPAGATLEPRQPGRWLVVFCDEINLPAPDAYATQRVIGFLRQLVEQRGFWRASDRQWVRLERVQFVGACNPPTDVGRVPLSPRFLRHAPVLMVDYPGEASLQQIYATFSRAVLRAAPTLRGHAEALAHAMVAFYTASQCRFTPEVQAHYVYSPRELTRWVRGVYRALRDAEAVETIEELVRIWAYEGVRLFRDRLVDAAERQWTDEALDAAAHAHFPGADLAAALARPILYSDWLTKRYTSVARAPLRDYAQARLRGYSEEELESSLVFHDAVLDLALSCDRVLRQASGHLLLIGVSGSGRTSVTRFCAWLRGLSLYSVPSAADYDEARFEEDLRALLRRVGVRGDRVCWTIDESQVAHPARLEKLNTLLANVEVAGLFEGDELASLLSALREAAQREGLVISADEELLAFFRAQIVANLHVVITMHPPDGGLGSKAAASPALFNRCTLVYCW